VILDELDERGRVVRRVRLARPWGEWEQEPTGWEYHPVATRTVRRYIQRQRGEEAGDRAAVVQALDGRELAEVR
jgi:hypothetical protein